MWRCVPFPVVDVLPAPAASPAATASATAVAARPTGPRGSADRPLSAERLTAETEALRDDKRFKKGGKIQTPC